MISAVRKQVISLPLTFVATAYAIYKVKDQGTVLLFILIAYLAYSTIAFFILKVSSFNIKCFHEDETEEEYIKMSYSKLYPDFKSDFIKIQKKYLILNL